ncbi:Hypothetical protein Minf_1722 [Methylacidiphilum infernorum V4]|uniref:Uncharacterized protein n=1 Tax=Methylacidiphilum infernorum (isolate V4) TaxID=481448 RepID=B3DX67_METI4|nr:Hypothetical protein Minf_1722 [Methylacidiphilum infernorum V4]
MIEKRLTSDENFTKILYYFIHARINLSKTKTVKIYFRYRLFPVETIIM